jgi:hypothetical protein
VRGCLIGSRVVLAFLRVHLIRFNSLAMIEPIANFLADSQAFSGEFLHEGQNQPLINRDATHVLVAVAAVGVAVRLRWTE